MDKLKMQTANKADENFKKLAEMFPNAVTETIDENGEVVRAIDKDVLMQEINTKVVDGNEERYQFTWPDKKKSVLLANAPINKTLRPCREESVDFDNTENLYIEGDNLEVLKLLQETYLGKIKMIYIDPPYNTGNDFVYEDDFAQSTEEYLANSGQYDDNGNRLVPNTESNGRFHTDWLNMMYPRLRLAKDLLSDDGVIFISIDDNEVENLKKCCDEIFGSNNFFACIVWRRQDGQTNIGNIARVKEYILIYSKQPNPLFGRLPLSEKAKKDYQYKDDIGYYGRGRLREPVRGRYNYDVTSPSGIICKGPWLIPKSEFIKLEEQNLVHWPEKEGGSPRRKIYLKDMLDKGQIANDFWGIEYGTNQRASIEVENLFGKRFFDFPKPVSLLSTLVRLGSNNNSIILDFFSGSATTAHAVMQLNTEDGGNRKFIMVQLPEKTDEKSEAYKAGYKNICEIGKERIRRAGNKIIEESFDKTRIKKSLKNLYKDKVHFEKSQDKNWIEQYFDGEMSLEALKKQFKGTENILKEINEFIDELKILLKLDTTKIDLGFRVLKCDSSNMKDVYYNPADYEQSLFSSLEDNIKEDRSLEDLLFQVMLNLGVLLSSKIEETVIDGKKVFNVADGFLFACFDENVTETTITAIAKQKPYYFVMRDRSMASDSVATNFDQIFSTYSPETVRKVL